MPQGNERERSEIMMNCKGLMFTSFGNESLALRNRLHVTANCVQGQTIELPGTGYGIPHSARLHRGDLVPRRTGQAEAIGELQALLSAPALQTCGVEQDGCCEPVNLMNLVECNAEGRCAEHFLFTLLIHLRISVSQGVKAPRRVPLVHGRFLLLHA